MANQIGGIMELKTEKMANLSYSQQAKNPILQESEKQPVSGGENFPKTSSAANLPDVSVVINGEEKASPKEEKKKSVTADDAQKMSEALNEFMDRLNCNLHFKYHKKLDLITIQMLNKKTKEVIKEFPPEEIIKTMEKTKEWIGIFLDKKA